MNVPGAFAESRVSATAAVSRGGDREETFDLASTMTLLLLLFFGADYWYLEIPLVLLCALGLLYPAARREAGFWFLITILLVSSNLQNWYVIDNHKYLITYWCLAFCLAVSTADPQQSLAKAARLLIGFAFLFAILWKLVFSADYTNYHFFYNTLLLEPRFATIAKSLGGVTDPVLTQTAEARHILHSFDVPVAAVPIVNSARLLLLAKFMTWWTIGIEGAIALAFCLPERPWNSYLGNSLLLLFLVTTYSAASVIGFGWVLSVMGFAGCANRFTRARGLYVAAFLIIFCFSGPWSSFFTGLVDQLRALFRL